jgi:hypothetical protein
MSDTKLGTSGLALHNDKYPLIYRGKVLSNTDPIQAGRIKIQVYPMFAGITNSVLLPWAIPANPIWDGAGAGIGHFAVPDVNSYVYVFFEQGDHYQPVYFAEAPTATLGLPSDRTVNYPNRKVVKSSSGITFIVDDTAQHVRINHPTGTYALIDTVGNITLDPNSTHRVIINAFSRTLEWSLGGALIGNDGGMIFFTGPLTFNLPSCIEYPGLEYIFKRMDAGVTPATVLGLPAPSPMQIEPNPNPFRLITGLYATLHLISGGSDTGMWHEI